MRCTSCTHEDDASHRGGRARFGARARLHARVEPWARAVVGEQSVLRVRTDAGPGVVSIHFERRAPTGAGAPSERKRRGSTGRRDAAPARAGPGPRRDQRAAIPGSVALRRSHTAAGATTAVGAAILRAAMRVSASASAREPASAHRSRPAARARPAGTPRASWPPRRRARRAGTARAKARSAPR
jgi:hypothetical protein